MSEPQAAKKRVRRRNLAIHMELTLRDAEAAATADISTQKLIQTRLNILSKALARERSDKLKRALATVERLTAENLQLKAALAAKPAARPLTDIERVIAQYESEKVSTQKQQEEQ